MTDIEILQEQFKAAANKYPGLEHTLEDQLTEDCDPPVPSEAAERQLYKLSQEWNNKEKSVEYSPWEWSIRGASEKGYPKKHYLHRSPHQQWDAHAAFDLFLLRAEEAGRLLIPLPELEGLWVADPAEYWLLALHRVYPGLKLKATCELSEFELEMAAGGSYLYSLHPRKGDEYFELLDDVFVKSALLCGELITKKKATTKNEADCTKSAGAEQETEPVNDAAGSKGDNGKMKKQTKTKKSPEWKDAEIIPDTPESMADMFKFHAETLTRKWNEFSHKPKDPELAICHGTYEQAVSTARDLTKKYLDIDLPELPKLPGNDYLAGINHLARYCKDAARTLTEKPDDSKLKDIEIDPETKEQQWREDTPEYIPNADAIRMVKEQISPTDLTRHLRKPSNKIRWMRNDKTKRSKVHTQDFKKNVKSIKTKTDEFSEAAFKQRARQEEIDQDKT